METPHVLLLSQVRVPPPWRECTIRLVDVKVAASECGFLFVLLRETTAAAYIYLPFTKSEMSNNGSRCGAADIVDDKSSSTFGSGQQILETFGPVTNARM